MIGSFIKLMINLSFNYLFFGMFLIGVSQVLLLNSIVNLSNDWFSPSERIFTTSLSCSFYICGQAVGFAMTTMWIDTEVLNY